MKYFKQKLLLLVIGCALFFYRLFKASTARGWDGRIKDWEVVKLIHMTQFGVGMTLRSIHKGPRPHYMAEGMSNWL